MPVELRKRSAPTPAVPAPPSKKKAASAKSTTKDSKPSENGVSASTNGVSAPVTVAAGDIINLDGFGGTVETQDGQETTLKKLVDASKNGIVLFTYPKASTPGCTTQACLFRDSYTPLTATGFAIYGLSTDSPKSNTTFKTKQNLPYPLLCDPKADLIGAIGLKKAPKGTTRGVFVINKEGKVLAAEPGSPAGTVEVVRKLVDAGGATEDAGNVAEGEKVTAEVETNAKSEEKKEDVAAAEVAADVADSAAKIDGSAKDSVPAQ
ncbi:MAG: hypothetical protein M1817_006032 [Caeruleum heppii]|nr:MAG: hypothetical protein M1817_006032 [Caeruleum heppii]